MTHRFLDEYANFKKRQAKTFTNKAAREDTLDQIEKIRAAAHRGIITVDEAMRLLSDL